MLNFKVAMILRILFGLSIWFSYGWVFVLIDQPEIISPQRGAALQGVVNVVGRTEIPGFKTAEIAFAYDPDPTNTWFLIQKNDQAVNQGTLTSWDTTMITDGTYQIRVRVILSDGQYSDRIVTGLRVRNYSPVETNTPRPVQTVQSTQTIGSPVTLVPATITVVPPTVTVTPYKTPVQILPNPAQLTPYHLLSGLIQGIAFTLVIFILLGLYLGLRSLIKR